MVCYLCPRLNFEDNKVTKGGKNIILCEMKTSFTFCYGIFIGSRRSRFLWTPHHHIQIKQISFSAFDVVILYSFLTMPALDHGSFNNFRTSPEQGAFRGMSVMECSEFFDAQLIGLRSRAIVMVDKTPGTEPIRRLAKRSIFLPRGTYDNQKFQEWRQSLISSGDIDPQIIQTAHIPSGR
ncbi:MAG: hypothetical protein ABSE69_15200 [Roseiarcus sp.]